MRLPSLCQTAGFRVPISIRRIRCETPSVIVDPFNRSATRLSKRSWPATATRNSLTPSDGLSSPSPRGTGHGDALPAADSFARAAVRVALRQLQAVEPGFTGTGGLALGP